MSQAFSKIWIAVVLIIFLAGMFFVTWYLRPWNWYWVGPNEVITRCKLSLCGCRCYPESKTPEEVRGVLCGVNCKGIYGIEGCKLINIAGIIRVCTPKRK